MKQPLLNIVLAYRFPICYNFLMNTENELCPCGSGKKYSECCEPLIKGTVKAATAEILMRARYSAYVKQEIDFIVKSCEEGEKIAQIDRKATEDWSKNSTWHGLKILRTEKGSEDDTEGLVEFTATYTRKGIRDIHHELAEFKKIDGEWFYYAGDVKPETVVRESRKIGRNEPCPCGSGKKYKNCCGR
jgi:SEC-C motif-containing protein